MNKDLEVRITRLLTHIKNVREACEKLGFELIRQGETNLGLDIIARGLRHDNSKFYGDEWEGLSNFDKYKGTLYLERVIREHTRHNDHHPECKDFEYIGFNIPRLGIKEVVDPKRCGIHRMNDAQLGEFICDLYARGKEFGNPVKEFLESKGFSKYNFTRNDTVYSKINRFHTLLTGQGLN